ncbi:hypothetical protein D1Y85_26605 [Paraburkholderia dinghuensis]|uniref:TniQ domain-containing protein n=1 Tax=Paraburkholderia dinghuensis TaxID=2305225 RepID=A0A3N6MEJ2_9BURK|nr:hypothetical protein D1Y85_26605 [Paraburkholderia dinghuensis]
MGRPLLIGVTPSPGESFSSVLLRTAEANGLPRPGLVLRTAGIASTLPRLQSEISALAMVCRLNVDLVRALLPLERGPGSQGLARRHRYQYYGATVGLEHLLVGRCERVCPVCIHTSGYLPAVHAFTLVTACPFHATRLLDHCPRCERAIDMMRPRLHLCQCGLDLGTVESIPASDDEMRVIRLVCRRWQFSFMRDLPPRCPDVPDDFNNLDLNDLLRAISFLCRLNEESHRTWRTVTQSKRIRAISWRVEHVGRLLRAWPHGFEDLIHRVRTPLIGGFAHGAPGRVGRASISLFSELPEPKFAFIHRLLVSSMQQGKPGIRLAMAEA